ncbi:MAG TPA: hypothetical protein VKY27_08470 [Bacteriovoracaceae bacterium]|nr:hypothetical protein [Bacteriovoracaceae bacterium]
MKYFTYFLAFFFILASAYAQEVKVEKFEGLKDNIFIGFSKCVNVGTDLWTGNQRIVEGELISSYCRPSDLVVKCSYMDSQQKIFSDEMFEGAIYEKLLVLVNDNTSIVGDVDSKIVHLETTWQVEKGRGRITKVCTGGWDYESNLEKMEKENEEAKKNK